jgi:hypothetical protein
MLAGWHIPEIKVPVSACGCASFQTENLDRGSGERFSFARRHGSRDVAGFLRPDLGNSESEKGRAEEDRKKAGGKRTVRDECQLHT